MSEAIARIAARGDGVTASGRYVPLTAPGDTVDDSGTVTPGPHHVDPPCRHFPACGGCQLQHVDDAVYGDFLVARITEALVAQGLAVPEMRAPHLSPPRTRRRAALRAERIGRKVVIGFNEGASHRVVDMLECHVLRPELFALVAPLRALIGPMLRERRPATVRMTLLDQGIDLAIEGIEADGLAAAEALSSFAERHRLARLSIDDGYGPQTRWEPDAATVTFGGIAVPFPAAGFLQATADGEAALVAAVREAVSGAGTVLDLFSGLGTFALALDARVLAAEGARDAALALKAAAARGGRQVLVDHRDLFRRPYPATDLARFDAIVIDPPRAGAKEQAPAIAASGVARIAHVSCNPSTFARDARTLVDGGYRIDWIKPVGQFRWSTHVELVAAFVH